MKSYRKHLHHEKWQLLLATFLGGCALAASLLLLVFSAWLISSASLQPPILTLEVAIVSVRFFGISRGAFRYAGRLVDHNTALRIQGKLRSSLYRSLATTPNKFAPDVARGKMLTTVVQAIDSVHDLWIRIASPYISSLFTSLVGLGVIHQLCPPLLIPLSITIFFAFVTPLVISYFQLTRKANRSQRIEESAIYEDTEVLLSSLRESIVFHYFESIYAEIVKSQSRLKKILNQKYFFQFINELQLSVFFGVALFLTIRYGIEAIHSGGLPGVNFAVVALIPLAIFDPISSIPASLLYLGRSRESEAEINSFIGSEENTSHIIDEFSSQRENSAPRITSLELMDMNAILGDHEFSPVSLVMKNGDTALISGKSGSGKSSFVNALIGQLPYSGRYEINGSSDVSKFFSRFSVLLQDDHLFTTSLRENLLIANPQLSEEEIWNLLEMVELRDRFENDPLGLDVFVGASIGVSTIPISAGEAQRIRFIRSLARPADIFIWDEPFEYLDKELISRIIPRAFEYLEKRQNPMVLVISHIPISLPTHRGNVHHLNLAQ